MSRGKEIKHEALCASYCFIVTIFDNFDNTGAQMLDSIYHMMQNKRKLHFWHENVKI